MANIMYMTTFWTHADEPTMKNMIASLFSKTTWACTALEGGGGNTIFSFDFLGRGHFVSSRWREFVLHAEWAELHNLQCEQNGHLTDWRRTFTLNAAGCFLNSWISVKASSTVVINWVTNKGGHKYACSLLVKTGQNGIRFSLFRRNRSLKRANYSANSARHTLLKLSLEDGDELHKETQRLCTKVNKELRPQPLQPHVITRFYYNIQLQQ